MYENYRMPGEFEKRSNVYVTWLPDYIRAEGYDNRQSCVDVIKALLEYGDVTVNLNCGTPGSYEEACSRLKEEGVDLDRIEITQFEDSNFYVRDNGPSIMVDDKGHSYMVNPAWTYYGVWDKNSPECQSARKAAVHMAVALGCFDIVNSEMVSEGGDREFDGHGTLIAIEDTECRKRNPEFTKEEVEAEYKRIYNLNKVIWLPQPMLEDDDYRLGILDEKEDGTPVFGMSFAAHIDEMCRFITPNKILLAEVSDEEAASSKAGAESRRRIEAAYEILSNETDWEGKPFEIVRMPIAEPIEVVIAPGDEDYELYKGFIDEMGGKFMDGTPWPEGPVHFYAAASYCNFLICNGVVLGQRYYHEGMSEVVKEKDEQAKAVLESCFPDRKVIMIDSLALNLSGGGVHCWTKDVAASR